MAAKRVRDAAYCARHIVITGIKPYRFSRKAQQPFKCIVYSMKHDRFEESNVCWTCGTTVDKSDERCAACGRLLDWRGCL